jgi:valyl-tRNA synthetase
MRLFNLPRIIATLLGAVISLPVAALAQAQDAQSQQSAPQDSSVADAARRNRDKKKSPSNPPKSAKVITDDDLDRRNFSPGQEGLNVGSPPKLETEPPSPQAVAAAEASDKAEQGSVKEAGEQDAEIARLKERTKDAEKDLELARRQAALDQDSFLSQPDYAHDAAGKAKLESEKQQINDKQQEVERLKTRLAALEELKSHRKPSRTRAAAPPKTENPPSAPPQS